MRNSRRGFFAAAAALTTGAAAALGRAAPAGGGGGGLLDRRIRLSYARLVGPGFPAFTPRFVLADVALDPGYPRLYAEFSGDISGRYLEALARHSDAAAARSEPLAAQLLGHQRADGRFGDERVSFADASTIGKPHMALLWGNGRLLVGLLAQHQARPRPEVLAASRRLGDFLLGVRAQCARPEVARRLEGLGAHGIICFTQLIEGLVMLGRATGDARYLRSAREIAFLLPPRGLQHSHGYLSTLRGVLLLHQAAPEARLLAFVEERFADLIGSPDHLVFGGVMEFFGAKTRGLSFDDLKHFYEFAQKDPQDEGCSEADFLRLALDLWRATGKRSYLELGERCLFNQFLANQFHTGDFGHRILFLHGFRASPQAGMAWWCCSMHGLRALTDVREALVSRRDGLTRVDLFLDGAGPPAGLDELAVSLEAGADAGRARVRVDGAPARPAALAIRQPEWASGVDLHLNGRPVDAPARDGYRILERRWSRGDRIDVAFDLRSRIETRDGRVVGIETLGPRPEEGALFHGPWLLGVHEAEEPLFFRRPWAFRTPNNDNVIRLPRDLASARVPVRPMTAADAVPPPPLQLRLGYSHGGWPESGTVTMRPLAAQTSVPHQQTLAVWLPYARG